MAKIVKLKESDLKRLVNKVLDEQMDVSSDSEHYVRRKREITIPFDELSMLGQFAMEFCRDKEHSPDCKEVRKIHNRYNLFM